MKGLTDKQQGILDFVAEFGRREGMAPTVYEIAAHFSIKPATAFAHLRALQRKGFVNRSSKARSLTLVRGPSPKHLSLSLTIPILGRISAGVPLFAEQNREDSLALDPALLPYGISGHRLFALHVKGDSMKDAGIMEGDLVIVKETNSPQIGDIAVALVADSETTVKYFHLAGGKVELRPANDAYQPQTYNLTEIPVQGVVVSLFRRY